MRTPPCLPSPTRARLAALAFAATLSACIAPAQQRAGALEFLYPSGAPFTPPGDVHLALPLRVGIAFAPPAPARASSPDLVLGAQYTPGFGPTEEQALCARVEAAFRATPGVTAIERIPSHYLRPGGGFENVDQLRALFGIDLLALVSYDQVQHQDYGWSSLTYLTLVGAYVFEGNANETRTFVEISVFDIPSRSLMFSAQGTSRVEDQATALAAFRELRDDSSAGFAAATDVALARLAAALEAFREQARTGTVRGAGTPALTVSGHGAGAFGPGELLLALALLAPTLAARRRAVSLPILPR